MENTVTPDALLLAWLRSRLPASAGVGSSAITSVRGGAAGGLIGDEAALIRHAGPVRQAEFRAGRTAARAALASIGIPSVEIMAHPDGDPIWPSGLVGSISHSRNQAVAAVARRGDLRGVGLDLEDDAPLEPGVAELICRPEERGRDPILAARGLDPAKLRFVAKEAWYKAVFPDWRRFIGFEEATVDIDATGGRFHARYVGQISAGPTPPSAGGDFFHAAGFICAICTLPF